MLRLQKQKKELLKKLLNHLSFKLDHKDYVKAYSLIFDLKLGDIPKTDSIEIFKQVAHIENEYLNYKTFSVIRGDKK